MDIVLLKERPDIAAIVKRAIPGYRKPKVYVTHCKRITPFGFWWDGGSKTDYHTALPDGRDIQPANPKLNVPFNVGERIVIETGVFRGKTATAHLYLPEETPAPAPVRLSVDGCPHCAAAKHTQCHAACPEPQPEVPQLILC